jgi:hypothetical protein
LPSGADGTAVALALGLSSGLCAIWAIAIQVPADAKVQRLHFGLRILTYWLVCELLYCASTLLAFAVLKDRSLPGPSWVWAALVGVFGFEFVIKRLGVAIGEAGSLSFQDWLAKSLSGASAEAVEKEAVSIARWAATNSLELSRDTNLDTYVALHLGAGQVQELEKFAEENSADASIVKAFALASRKPQAVAAILQGGAWSRRTRTWLAFGAGAALAGGGVWLLLCRRWPW